MPPVRLLLATLLLAAPLPAQAQFGSDSYKFLQAVRDAKGDDVMAALGKPGSNVINTRDPSNGETSLHIIVRRGDATYLRFFLAKGADPNLRDAKGTTPLLLAVTLGQGELIPILTAGRANVNLANSSGETPLIRAVQRRDIAMVRDLLAAGADPDQPDVIAGKSARDYATLDTRNSAAAKLLADVPKKARRAVAGPKL